MRLSNSRQMRDADSRAIHVAGIPSTLLMTNAAAHISRAALELLGTGRSAVVFCGSGNNGGDGIASALYLMRRGVSVRVLFAGQREKMTPDTREMERRLIESDGALEDFDPDCPALSDSLRRAGVIIDAMFGIGLNSDLRGKALAAVRMINASGVPVVSADIPSGVEADTGRILGDAVKATRTVTFSMAKPGHFVEPGCTKTGELEIADIGIPGEFLEDTGGSEFAITEEDARLPVRPKISHKGDYGKLLIVAGSTGYTGAPSLSAHAAVRSGAGLVYIGVPKEIYRITAVKNDEAMPFPLACDERGTLNMSALPVIREKLSACDVCVIGPGLGRSDEITELVCALLSGAAAPMVLDADALFAVSRNIGVIKSAAKPIVLTPHEGEFLRLGGTLSGDRIRDAREFALLHECILVLKGHRTICAFPDGEIFINTCGNPGMAKGGTGDVLAGIIGALMGQLPLKKAVTAAVWIHGRGGDICAERLGEYSMNPTDLISALPEVMKSITR